MKKIIACSLALLWNAGCTEPEKVDNVALADKLLLTTKPIKSQIKADGKDTAYLLARLPHDAGVVDVTFTTTGGTFVFSGGSEIKDYADSSDGTYRYATALLKADTIPKQVYVTAEIASVRNRISLTFTK